MEFHHKLKLAVALKYRQDEDVSPLVVASGRAPWRSLVKKAMDLDIPIHPDGELAELLEVDVGHSIPEELYEVVAQIMAMVYRMDAALGTENAALKSRRRIETVAHVSGPYRFAINPRGINLYHGMRGVFVWIASTNHGRPGNPAGYSVNLPSDLVYVPPFGNSSPKSPGWRASRRSSASARKSSSTNS